MSSTLQILIDSDSCPKVIRDIILRACRKNDLTAVFAADRTLGDVNIAIAEHTRDLRECFVSGGGSREDARGIRSTMRMDVVSSGENSADDHLVGICEHPCLAVTRDIPLAARLIEKGAVVVTDRGMVLDPSNIRQRLSERQANSVFREAGLFETEQNQALGARDIREFGSRFNALLQSMLHLA